MPQSFFINVTVDPVKGTIKCDPKGGHAHCRKSPGQFQWKGDTAFTLAFEDFDTGQGGWPFSPPEPKWPVTDTGVVTFQNTAGATMVIKYTVTATGGTKLDPIIVVDK